MNTRTSKLAGVVVAILFIALWVPRISRAVYWVHWAEGGHPETGSFGDGDDAAYNASLVFFYCVSLLAALVFSWLLALRPRGTLLLPFSMLLLTAGGVNYLHPEQPINLFPPFCPWLPAFLSVFATGLTARSHFRPESPGSARFLVSALAMCTVSPFLGAATLVLSGSGQRLVGWADLPFIIVVTWPITIPAACLAPLLVERVSRKKWFGRLPFRAVIGLSIPVGMVAGVAATSFIVLLGGTFDVIRAVLIAGAVSGGGTLPLIALIYRCGANRCGAGTPPGAPSDAGGPSTLQSDPPPGGPNEPAR